MSLYCTVSEILSLISQKLKRSRDSKHIPKFTNSTDIIGAKFKENESRDPDHAHLGVI